MCFMTLLVTYWPFTEPSIKRRNRCTQSRISEYHLDLWTWLNLVQMHTPTGSRWVSNNYIIRCHRWLELVSSSRSVRVPVGESCGQDAELRASNRQRARALSDPWLSSPTKMRKKGCYGREKNFGSVCGSLSLSPTHLSHITNIDPFTTLSRIKC